MPQAALSTAASGSSPGQQALVQAAVPRAPADIRTKVDALASTDAPKPGLTDRLLFWMRPAEPGVTVDADKEARRLRENAALGQSVQQGETSIIQPKSKNIFSDLF